MIRLGCDMKTVLFLLALVHCVSAFAAPIRGCGSIVSTGFESGSLDALPPGVSLNSPSASDAITIVNSVARGGTYSTRVMIKNSPEYIYNAPDVGRKIRAEYSAIDAPGVSFAEGQTRHYSFSMMLAPTWVFDSPNSVDIVWQFKTTGGQPDMFVAVKGNNIVLRIGSSSQITLISGIRPGAWVDLVLLVNWSASSVGQVDSFFRYDVQTTYISGSTYHGPTLGTRPGKTYIKWGIYKPDNYENSTSTGPHLIYFDNIAVGCE